jgi:prolyl-tRNA synthetase
VLVSNIWILSRVLFFLTKMIPFNPCSNIVDVSSYGELKEAIAEGKWARGPWSAR